MMARKRLFTNDWDEENSDVYANDINMMVMMILMRVTIFVLTISIIQK